MITSEFNIGDEVIYSDGELGKIIEMCDCDICIKRGFIELIVEVEGSDSYDYITDYDMRNNFKSYFKIGSKFYGNLISDENLANDIEDYNKTLKDAIRDYEHILKVKKRVELLRIEHEKSINDKIKSQEEYNHSREKGVRVE